MRNANTKRTQISCCGALENTTSLQRILMLLSLVLFFLSFATGCATTKPKKIVVPQIALPSFVPHDASARDDALDHAAATLCLENIPFLSDAHKEELGLFDGTLFVLVERKKSLAMSLALLEDKGARLLKKQNATHTGFYISSKNDDDDEPPCVALVAARRKIEIRGQLMSTGHPGEKVRVRLFEYVARNRPKKGKTTRLNEERRRSLAPEKPTFTFFSAKPDGRVEKRSLEVDDDHVAELTFSYDAGPGRYTLEVLFDDEDSPEVALLWSVQVGEKSRTPPAPNVLFNDDGHSDVALTRRAEALVQRLRTQQDIEVLRIAPALADIAEDRAAYLTKEGKLGHRLPDGKTALDELRQSGRGFYASHLAEVQAQGSTLEDAWKALLRSPAHRYEMVHPGISHMGIGVVRGRDSVGRSLLTLVSIFAKKNRKESPKAITRKLKTKFNSLRKAQKNTQLTSSKILSRIAKQQAEAMAQAGLTDETLLDAGLKNRPVAVVALDAHPKMKNVKSVLGRLDDPLRLGANESILDAAATHIGIGIARGAQDGQWYVCVLIGLKGPPD